MEAVSWVCDDALDEHLWVSEHTISCQEAKVVEALQYDLQISALSVGNGMVLGTDKSQQWFFERWSYPREVQRSGEFWPLWVPSLDYSGG